MKLLVKNLLTLFLILLVIVSSIIIFAIRPNFFTFFFLCFNTFIFLYPIVKAYIKFIKFKE